MSLLLNTFIPDFLNAGARNQKVARLGNNKSFSVIGEFIEEDVIKPSLQNNGDFIAYEIIEKDNVFYFKKGIGETSNIGTENNWNYTLTKTWQEILNYGTWNDILSNAILIYSHEFIEVDSIT